MPCLTILLALAFPRLLLAVLFFASTYLERAIDTGLFLLLGFFFLPITTLAYAWAINTNGSVDGIYLAAVVVAALLDVGAIGGGEAHRRRR